MVDVLDSLSKIYTGNEISFSVNNGSKIVHDIWSWIFLLTILCNLGINA